MPKYLSTDPLAEAVEMLKEALPPRRGQSQGGTTLSHAIHQELETPPQLSEDDLKLIKQYILSADKGADKGMELLKDKSGAAHQYVRNINKYLDGIKDAIEETAKEDPEALIKFMGRLAKKIERRQKEEAEESIYGAEQAVVGSLDILMPIMQFMVSMVVLNQLSYESELYTTIFPLVVSIVIAMFGNNLNQRELSEKSYEFFGRNRDQPVISSVVGNRLSDHNWKQKVAIRNGNALNAVQTARFRRGRALHELQVKFAEASVIGRIAGMSAEELFAKQYDLAEQVLHHIEGLIKAQEQGFDARVARLIGEDPSVSQADVEAQVLEDAQKEQYALLAAQRRLSS